MGLFEQGTKSSYKVSGGNNVLRIGGLKPGTLYAVMAKGYVGARSTNVITALSSGSGYSLITSLTSAAQTLQSTLQAAYGVVAPNSYMVAGADTALAKYTPQYSINYASSTPTLVSIRVAAPSFNQAPDANVTFLRCNVSRDKGATYDEVYELSSPFEAGFGVFSIPLPYESELYAVFRAGFADGSAGPATRPLHLTGIAKPAVTTSVVAPVVTSISGAYKCADGKVSLDFSVECSVDAQATDVVLQMLSGNTVLYQATATPVDSIAKFTLPGIDPSVASYKVVLTARESGVRGPSASTNWDTASAAPYLPPAFDLNQVLLSETITLKDGALHSSITADFSTAVGPNAPKGALYTRRADGKDVNALTLEDFTYWGDFAGVATSGEVVAGRGVAYQVVVLSVSPTGTKASFSTTYVKILPVTQYADYVPPQQPAPIVTVLSETSIRLDGTYKRGSYTPEPIEIRAYADYTSCDSATALARATYTRAGSGDYAYSMTITDLSAFKRGSVFIITLRSYLENKGITSDDNSTSVKVTPQLPAVPVIGAAMAFVKTVRATVTTVSDLVASSATTWTPTVGNGVQVTVTAAAHKVRMQVSGDAAGEVLNPSMTIDGTSLYVVLTPSVNQGTKSIQAAWDTPYGVTAWSTAASVTFAADSVVDTTPPDLSPCAPRFVCNSDGTITISWSAATLNIAALGSYTIRRAKTNNVSNSTTVGTVTTSTALAWTDYNTDAGTAYYYWIEASNAQGYTSVSPAQVKLSSAKTYAAETVVAAVAADAIPSTVSSITAVGSQGGFAVAWSPVSDLDLQSYRLEFSAAGNFSDTVVTDVTSNTYYQTLGATASYSVATNYRWRVKAVDRGNQVSAAYATSDVPDLTNYGSIQDSAPATPAALTLVPNSDGSVTLTLPATTAPYFHCKRLSSNAAWTPATAGAADAGKVEAEFILPGTAGTYTDTGLNTNKFYTYQLFTRSKLGTDSSAFAAPPTPVQVGYLVPGVMRKNLVMNGHFGNAQGAYGTSYTGWSLISGAAFAPSDATYTYNSAAYALAGFSATGTAAQLISQVIQVLPGKRYTVQGLLRYTGADGHAYLRVVSTPAVTLSDASGGQSVPPAPYPPAAEANGTDSTTANSHRFVSYSFTVPAGVSQVSIVLGFEGRAATSAVSVNPGFVQVFLDS